ncbi:peptide/nickel transport system permease protein [Mesorhizobium sp. J18]|uniref:ABC transporter permease n=1 Tax=Mesorhizobium sp. J18 TaxID=935263 RepID=UPI001199725B|nr:ABC transporter permease [Mesorhizobium sp. J18]TWG94622.1 peptide/nickel transport system permease protein [Mesorhizobium sp. J18]
MGIEQVGTLGIILGVISQFWPVWLALAIVLVLSVMFKRRLGLYGQLFDSGVGIAGVMICLFWLFTAIFADTVAPFAPLQQFPLLKDAMPGSIEPGSGKIFLFGGDKLARDVFSRMVHGSRIVLVIAPAATLFALMVGTTLGLPAGYYGGRIDTVLSFLANLVLAFPVILLFYLLVTPGIMDTAIPYWMAGIFFIFPIIFFCTLFYTRFRRRPQLLAVQLALTILIGGWIYAGLVFNADPLGIISIRPNELNIFVAVVFASSPGVFRIVRGLVMDIKTRDYVAAAQTRGENPWYIMLWEILPNARGPLIVDVCLRIGYTTILLGTLGYFGLGLAPESPDWGTGIKESSRLLRLYIHPALPPVLALMSFVLGLNLLADALREQSLKD